MPINLKSLVYFFFCFFLSTGAYASDDLQVLSSVDSRPLQEIVDTADDYFELFNSTTGSCAGISIFGFQRSNNLIGVARKSVYQANPGYDYPRQLNLRYLGVLDDTSASFIQSLEGLMGGRQQSFVRHYFEENDDQDALNEYWATRDAFQKQLGTLSRQARILVYRGYKENSFGRSDLVVLLDPTDKQLVLFQAGWCE